MKDYPKILIILALMVITFSFGLIVGKAFHHPSEAVVGDSPSATCLYYPSYKEMQIWAGVEPDGFWGPISDKAYRAKRDRVYGNKMAMLTWPELEN